MSRQLCLMKGKRKLNYGRASIENNQNTVQTIYINTQYISEDIS
jgi:hypothetical protein